MTGLARRVPTAIAYGALILAAVAGPWPMFVVLMLALFALGVVELAVLHRGRSQTEQAAVVAVGALYLLLGLGASVVLWGAGGVHAREMPDFLRARGFTNAPAWLLLALIPTWAADVASYAVGSLAGRRQLAPRISPGKTWEGTIGGFAAAALTAVAIGAVFGLPTVPVAIAAAGLGPVALAGDLIESWMKRRVEAKDSGSILPGHGGTLDRIDSLLTVGPFVGLLLLLADRLG